MRFQICARLVEFRDFKTNHSLHATAATRLYSSGIDEQLVMERTGHRSIEGICSYKRTSSDQQEAVSDILNHPKKKCIDVALTEPKEDQMAIGALMPSLTNSNTLSLSQIAWPQKQDLSLLTHAIPLILTTMLDQLSNLEQTSIIL